MHERTEPFYYFLLILLAGLLPWWPYLPKALYGIRKGFKLLAVRTLFQREEVMFFLTWTGVIFLFFSVSSSKLASYIAPVFPPLAVIMGHIFKNYEERSLANVQMGVAWRLGLNFPIALQAILFSLILLVPLFIPEYEKIGHPAWLWVILPMLLQGLVLLLPGLMKGRIASGWFLSLYVLSALYFSLILVPVSHYMAPGKSSLDLVKAVRTYLPPGEVLYQYKISMYGVDFYTGMRSPIVDDIGELKYGAERLPAEERRRYFPTAAEFIGDIEKGKGRYCITEGMGHIEGLKKQGPQVRVLWNNGKFYMLYAYHKGRS